MGRWNTTGVSSKDVKTIGKTYGFPRECIAGVGTWICIAVGVMHWMTSGGRSETTKLYTCIKYLSSYTHISRHHNISSLQPLISLISKTFSYHQNKHSTSLLTISHGQFDRHKVEYFIMLRNLHEIKSLFLQTSIYNPQRCPFGNAAGYRIGVFSP